MNRIVIVVIVFLSGYATVNAQADTLFINLTQADSIFQSKNFQLLAATMNIEAERAQIIQAKLYPNPVFSANFNAYDPENKKAFHAGATGQKYFELEQLIILGGKRKAEIELAKTNARIAELEFQQLMRQLKFQLHSSLFALGQQQQLLEKFSLQLDLLDTLLNAYQQQASKGNIALKEVVRLKGAYLQLNNDRAEIYKGYYEAHATIQTLLSTTLPVAFRFSDQDIENYIRLNTLEELRVAAQRNRPELLLKEQDRVLAEQYLHYQRKLAVPDLTVNSFYDQRSGAFNNELNVGISIPLPFWNRNKGNIQSARYRLRQSEYDLGAMQIELMAGIQNYYALYMQTVAEYKKAVSLYNEDFETTTQGMVTNFQKRNVSIIEFIDFFESYYDAISELARIRTQLVTSAEHLNALTGTDLY